MNPITLFIGALTANLIFTHALGMSTIVVSAKSSRSFLSTGFAIMLFSTLGSLIARLIAPFADSVPLLRPLFYVLILAALYVLVLLILHFIGGERCVRFRKYVHLSAFNCAVLGAMFLSAGQDHSILDSLLFGFQAGLGFLLASYILKAVYPSLTSEKVPASVRGYPAVLIYIGILAMAVYKLNQ